MLKPKLSKNEYLGKKITCWLKTNYDFLKSIEEQNLPLFLSLVENQETMISLDELLTPEEASQLKSIDYEELSTELESKYFNTFLKFFSSFSDKNIDFLESIAPFIFQKRNPYAEFFDRNYFMYTNNKKNALKNALNFIKNHEHYQQFLIQSLLYNKDTRIFQYIISKLNKHINLKLSPLLGMETQTKKYYNLTSYKKYYLDNYHIFQKEIKTNNFNHEYDVDAVICYSLIEYPYKKIYESNHFSEEIKDLFDFLLNKFQKKSNIKNKDLALIFIFYQNYIKYKLNFENNAKKNIKPALIRGINLRESIFIHKIGTLEDRIIFHIMKYINQNKAIKCLEFLNKIQFPKEKYSSLNYFLNLSTELPTKSNKTSLVQKI